MGKKIIIVDDDRKVQAFLHYSLAKHGYEVISAPNAESGLELIKAEKPDLLLVDILLPQKDGITLCETLRKDPALSGIPIILMTGIYPDYGIHMPKTLANDFIKKPFSIEEIMNKIHMLIG